MTRDEAKKLLPVIQAYVDGKLIQWKDPYGTWVDFQEPSFDPDFEYRIKPEPFECWITRCVNGGRCSHVSKEDAESYAKTRLPNIYTIHHMREVI